ncbi:hypothetical protein AC477_00030 [miscellaneous Crenarchaeota group-1 archaeon SG8-32-1]|uniref:Uncharacterized protein n=1 Tax=miscellaneous Crenarchaeota group-1 archaeon SG8-32-1 TaxID=1685124 RepID=A0A0M0C1E7_9ARCH|nr:MAG: hypothetical protein AC477_00030 [miscellaneous Crenarchaeota group-1 archaeon SG8-32-1]
MAIRCPKCGKEAIVLPRTVDYDGKQRMVRSCSDRNECKFSWMIFEIKFSLGKSDQITYDVVEFKKK